MATPSAAPTLLSVLDNEDVARAILSFLGLDALAHAAVSATCARIRGLYSGPRATPLHAVYHAHGRDAPGTLARRLRELRPFMYCVCKTEQTLNDYDEDIWAVDLSRDGARAVTASIDDTARVWDVRTGRCTATLAGHTGVLSDASFCADGRRVVTASDDGTARVWDAQTGACVATLAGHTDTVETAAFHPDGERVVTASRDGTTRIWDASAGRCITTLSGHVAGAHSAEFGCDDGHVLVSGARRLLTIDAATGAEVKAVPTTGAAFAVSDAHGLVAELHGDGAIAIRNTRTGEIERVCPSFNIAMSVAISGDGMLVAVGYEDGETRILDIATGACLQTLPGHFRSVSSLCFSADGHAIATASTDGTAHVWRCVYN